MSYSKRFFCRKIASSVRDVQPKYTGAAKRKSPGEQLRIPGVAQVIQKTTTVESCEKGDILKKRYEIRELLGRGRFGIVRSAFDLFRKEPVAIKVLNKQKERISCQTELLVYTTLFNRLGSNHDAKKYMTLPLDIYENEHHLYIIMEFISGGDLFDKIIEKEYFKEGEFLPIMGSLLHALSLLHDNGVVHRDIKPENVLLRRVQSNLEQNDREQIMSTESLEQPVLTDFGLSYVVGQPDLIDKPAGTFGYVCPEILSAANKSRSLPSSVWNRDLATDREIELNVQFKFASDIWSMGVLCYASLCGELPFPASMDGSTSVEEHLQQVYTGPKFQHVRWDHVSKDMKQLIADMLHYSPFNRPSLEYIKVQHATLRSIQPKTSQ